MGDWVKYVLIDLWYEIGHPNSKDYFWLGTPWPTAFMTLSYLYIVLKLGPDFMRNRKPYDLKIAIRLYNLLLVAINAYLFWGLVSNFSFGLEYWGCKYSLATNKIDITLHWIHLFFHTRYLEFLDTFFFVLRKKDSQMNFLHIFHHGIVPPLMYLGLKFYPIPFNCLLSTTNMFVHIIMYAYYGLATFGPKIQKYLWWKKYLTSLQIGQFALLLIHCLHALLFIGQPGCNFPAGLLIMNSATGLTFLSLFISFYKQTYSKRNSRQGSTGQPSVNGGQRNQRMDTTRKFIAQQSAYEANDSIQMKSKQT